MRALPTLLIMISCLLSVGATAAELRMEIIPLKHRPADTLIEHLRPLVDAKGSVSAAGNQLIINSTPANLAQLHLLIDELDKPLAQLMITVRRGNQVGVSSSGYAGSGTITSGNGSIIVTNNGNTRTTTQSNGGIITHIDNSTVTINRSTASASQSGISQVRATEGYPAFIQSGQQIPITQRGYDGRNYYENQEYKDVVKGFYVTPQIVGDDRVTLSVRVVHDEAQQNNHNRNNTIRTESMQATVSGRLGEWVSLGGINQAEQNTDQGIARRYSTTRSGDTNLFIKVDRVN